MLNDIALRPVLEDPAGENAVPFIVARLAHVELNEGAYFRGAFPWRCRLARAHAYHRSAPAQCFAGLHLKIARDAVPLVEYADHGNTFCHGCARQRACRAATRARHGAGARVRLGFVRRFLFTTSCEQGGRQGNEGETREPPARRRAPAVGHASGVHAS